MADTRNLIQASDLATMVVGTPTEGDDTLSSNVSETIDGLGGNDRITGGSGNQVLIGGSGNDTLEGGLGTDTLEGGAGDACTCWTKPPATTSS